MDPISLKCSNHNSSLINWLDIFKAVDNFVDVTLVCEGHTVKAHQIVLSAGSNVLRRLLLANSAKHPILILAETKYDTLRMIIDFLYKGRVDIPRNDLHKVLQVATTFEINDLKKLCEESLNNEKGDKEPNMHPCLKSPVLSASSPKRKRQRRLSFDSDILIHDTVPKTEINFSPCRLEQPGVSSFADALSVIAPTEQAPFRPQMSDPRSVLTTTRESSTGSDSTCSSVQNFHNDTTSECDILSATAQTEVIEFCPQISDTRNVTVTSVKSPTTCNLTGSSVQQIQKEASTECVIQRQKELECNCLPIKPTRAIMKPQDTEITDSDKADSYETSAKDLTKCIPLVNRLLQSFEKLKTEMMKVNNKVETVLNKVNRLEDYPVSLSESFPLVPPGIQLPIDCDEDLVELNNKLQEDTQLLTTLIHYLHKAGSGKSLRSYVSSIIKKLLSQKVALLYSRLGRKGKKCFMGLEQVLKAILTAASLKFPEESEEDLAVVFGKALAGAVDWEGRNFSSLEQNEKNNTEPRKTIQKLLVCEEMKK